MPKEKKRKKVNFKVIPAGSAKYGEPYRLMHEVRTANHNDTIAARIALAWKLREKSDEDGHLVLGRCVKVSDLHREFADFDFIIVLNQQVWDDLSFGDDRKRALLDHELCHCAPVLDEDTKEHKRDERNRLLFRMRKHDIEEFSAVVERHGTYKRDLEQFARVLMEKAKTPLFPEMAQAKPGPQIVN